MTIQHAVILNEKNNARQCTTRHCFNFVFVKVDDQLLCPRCHTVNIVTELETEGQYPRPGREFTDQLNQAPRYSFLRGESSVKRVRDNTGLYVDYHDVVSLMDAAQDEINRLKAELKETRETMMYRVG